MSDGLLCTAAVLLVITAFVHSVLGERRLIGPLLARREGVLASDLARFVLRFVWHLVSVNWAILALILVQLARDPATARFWAAVEEVCPDYREAEDWLKKNTAEAGL